MLRFSSPPAEDLTLADLRLAAIGYLLSRQRREPFIITIEDLRETGSASSPRHNEQDMLALLKKCAIVPEQLLYQSEHLHRYQQLALSLLEKDKAFACICQGDKAQHCTCLQDRRKIATLIQSEGHSFSIRLKRPQGTISFIDHIRGEVSTTPDEIGMPVILLPEGRPSQDFATACDDMLSAISVVMRHEATLEHTACQIHIKQSLEYSAQMQYVHLPPLLHDKQIRDSLRWLLEEGYLPDAILNHLLSLDIHAPQTHFTLLEALAWCDAERLPETPVRFDSDTLSHLNRHYLEKMDDTALSRIFGFADADIGRLLKCYLQEASTLKRLQGHIEAIFSAKSCKGAETDRIRQIAAVIQEAPMLDSFDAFLRYLTRESGLTEEVLLKPLRYLMTGTKNGPSLQDIYPHVKSYITEIARCTP